MNSESVKLDQILKSLFEVSSKAMIGVINECFDKNYEADEVVIEKQDPHYIKENLDYESIEADIVFKINDVKYHIEFQTRNDKTMEIRMFEYAFYIAKQDAKVQEDGVMTLHIPNQAVIFIEENKEIRDQKVRIIFPNGKEMLYDIETIRFWEYTLPTLREKKMYNLLPLVIFRHRKVLERVANNTPKLLEEKESIREDISRLSEEIKRMTVEHELEKDEDIHKIALAIANLTEYLNSKYIKDEDFDKEVIRVTKTLYDPLVEQRGREEGREEGEKRKAIEIAEKAIAKGLDDETIIDLTGLSIEEIRGLRTVL
ncbi:MAG: hypothetical protein ACRDDX_11280 [Cellulosilyticaceae bacterium]